MKIPSYLTEWFTSKDWKMHSFQKKMFTAFKLRQSTLLIVPTGGGKTLASFLPSLVDIHQNAISGLHTLYISPLKALAHDIERNLIEPIQQMELKVKVESRTGDTSTYRRTRQRKNPPHILLTTPESLFLMLSYPNSDEYFKNLKLVIIDELHSLAPSKRGDLTSLALSQLQSITQNVLIQFGLSATIADPDALAKWLGASHILSVHEKIKPDIYLLTTQANIPYQGYLASYAVNEIYHTISKNNLSIIFVNTRAQAEFMFRQLWELNQHNLPIAIYHGSLSKELRNKTENMIAENKIRAIVATSALELGIDWGNIDCVLQIGAPKGVSRLLQRIGRSNHRFDQASNALLVPANCFEVLECSAAMIAIKKNQLDNEELLAGSWDVVIQFIINCACSRAINFESIYQIITSAAPYQDLTRENYRQLFEFAMDGGYVLKHYERYHRLIQVAENNYEIASSKIVRRHRQNIGTIIEATRLKVRRIHKRGGKILGDIEENFAQQLTPGDTFLFNGEVLEFVRVRDMYLEAKRTPAKTAKIPSYNGGNLPLSTFLADAVKDFLNNPLLWKSLPPRVSEWLALQKKCSLIPPINSILIETFLYKKNYHLVIYTFQGRKTNQTLGILLSHRMEKCKLQPLVFSVTDYGLAIQSLKQVHESHLTSLFTSTILLDELNEWLNSSVAIKRAFRQVALISGLTERQLPGQRKSLRQVTFSTDLIYDVLMRYDPHHILLKMSKLDVERDLIQMSRLILLLQTLTNSIQFKELNMPSPLSIPIIFSLKAEPVANESLQVILENSSKEQQSIELMTQIKKGIFLK